MPVRNMRLRNSGREESQSSSVGGSSKRRAGTRRKAGGENLEQMVEEKKIRTPRKNPTNGNTTLDGVNEFTNPAENLSSSESIKQLVNANNGETLSQVSIAVDLWGMEGENSQQTKSKILSEFGNYDSCDDEEKIALVQTAVTPDIYSQTLDEELISSENDDEETTLHELEKAKLDDTQSGTRTGTFPSDPTEALIFGTTSVIIPDTPPNDQHNDEFGDEDDPVSTVDSNVEKKTRKPRTPKERLNGPMSPKRRSGVLKIARKALTKTRTRMELEGKKGQHKFNNVDVVVPTFTKELVKVLRSGDRKAIAKQFDNILNEIAADIAPREGSGSKTYYRLLEEKLLVWYPEINDPLIRNICRRRLKKKGTEITIAELSEDELEENVLLRPQAGQERRTVTTGNRALAPFSKVLSKRCVERRRKLQKDDMLKEAANGAVIYRGLDTIALSGWTRKSMAGVVDAEARRNHAIIRAATCEEQAPETDLLEAYRKTFVCRTDAVKCGTTKLETILEFYPMLTKKKFIDMEGELYMGSAEKLKQFHNNARATWQAMEKLNKTQTAEDNFKLYMLALGDEVVQFVEEAPADWCSKKLFPDILKISATGQVILRYKTFKWLEMDSIGEALGYLILLVTAFDFPVEGRPQLLFLLESIFYGYTSLTLKTTGLLLFQRLKQICDPDVESSSDDEQDHITPGGKQ